jgi:hypothetical protein
MGTRSCASAAYAHACRQFRGYKGHRICNGGACGPVPNRHGNSDGYRHGDNHRYVTAADNGHDDGHAFDGGPDLDGGCDFDCCHDSYGPNNGCGNNHDGHRHNDRHSGWGGAGHNRNGSRGTAERAGTAEHEWGDRRAVGPE